MNTAGMVHLLQKMRQESNGLGLLGVELVLHCAERPRTVAELCHLTGAGNGQVNRALNRMAMHWDEEAQEVSLPTLHLISKNVRLKRNRDRQTQRSVVLTRTSRTPKINFVTSTDRFNR